MKSVELSLRKCVTPEFIFGTGARNLTGSYARNLSMRHPLLVTDPAVRKTPWFEDVTASLEAARIDYVVFDDVVPNPRDTNVTNGVACYWAHHCDGIIALGGGSPMDCAKAIGIVVANGNTISAFEGVDQIVRPLPPLLCIPTTAGTSADVSQFAIIVDSARKVKMAIISKSIVPDLALIDPETTLSMELDLSINTGLDALTHAFEAYVSNAASTFTDMYALQSIEYLFDSLPKMVSNPNNMEARGAIMMGSLLAGLAFSNASLGAVHAMSHSLGGETDLPHGLCNAILLDHVVEFNYPHAGEKYNRIGAAMGKNLGNKTDLLSALRDFKTSLGFVATLGSTGLAPTLLPTLSATAVKDACIVTNPVIPTLQEIERIYEKAF
ncbi:MAG: iron-containing alcohol dehydrogenase [Campylobacterales bacterium]|nr:iron-containing alcohol dehydrogenase [Campylobacterales bacterium]